VADDLAVPPPAPPPGPEQGRNVKGLIRYALGACLGIVVLLLLFGKRGELVSALHQVSRADPAWVLVAAAAEAGSVLAFAYIQFRALKLSGTRVTLRAMTALSLANDAIANTIPGEPVVSSAYRYRYYRRRGATGASAGWTIFTILIAQAIGMSLILLFGVLVALLGNAHAKNIAITITGLVVVIAAGAVLVRRDLILRLAATLPRAWRRAAGDRHARVTRTADNMEATLDRMRQIPLSTTATIEIVAIATFVWLADFGCLVASFGAVHATVPAYGVLLAYGVAQVVGSLPFVPGGIGIIESSLAVILIEYGAGRVSALSAALVYRIISFWLGIAVGWITIAVISHRARRSTTEPASPPPAYADESSSQSDPSAARPDHTPG
jgi:putative heme transporter